MTTDPTTIDPSTVRFAHFPHAYADGAAAAADFGRFNAIAECDQLCDVLVQTIADDGSHLTGGSHPDPIVVTTGTYAGLEQTRRDLMRARPIRSRAYWRVIALRDTPDGPTFIL